MTVCNFMSTIGCGGMINVWLLWLIIGLTAFWIVFSRRSVQEGFLEGSSYNWIGALIGAIPMFIVIVFTASPRWTILAAVLGVAIGGFGAGYIMNGFSGE